MTVGGERTGVLVLKAWLEQQGSPLRVRITERIDLRYSEERSLLVAGAEAASNAVRDWLLRFESESSGAPPYDDPERSR
jgi:hypothetical protein